MRRAYYRRRDPTLGGRRGDARAGGCGGGHDSPVVAVRRGRDGDSPPRRALSGRRPRPRGRLRAGRWNARPSRHPLRQPRLQLLAVTVGLDLHAPRPCSTSSATVTGAGRRRVRAGAGARGTGPIPTEAWEHHEASCHYRDDEELAAASPSSCPSKHPSTGSPFVIWHPTLAVAHVWALSPTRPVPSRPRTRRWLRGAAARIVTRARPPRPLTPRSTTACRARCS